MIAPDRRVRPGPHQAAKLTKTPHSILTAAISGFYIWTEAHRYLVSVPLYSGRALGACPFFASPLRNFSTLFRRPAGFSPYHRSHLRLCMGMNAKLTV